MEDPWPIWMTWPSEKITYLIYGDEQMTLCSKAMEITIRKGQKSSITIRILDRIFWFDPGHCRVSYMHYRLHRLNRHKHGEF